MNIPKIIYVILFSLSLFTSCIQNKPSTAGKELITYLHIENKREINSLKERAQRLYINSGSSILLNRIEQLDSIQAIQTRLVSVDPSIELVNPSNSAEMRKDMIDVYSLLQEKYGIDKLDIPFKTGSPNQKITIELLIIFNSIIEQMEEDFWQAFLREIDSSTTVLAIPKSVNGDSTHYYIHTGYEGNVYPVTKLADETKKRLGQGHFQKLKIANKDLTRADRKINVFIPKLAGGGGFNTVEIELDNTIKHVGVK